MIDLRVCDAENKLYENHLIGINDKVIFVTENCAVTEYFDNGYFMYYNVYLKEKIKLQRNFMSSLLKTQKNLI